MDERLERTISTTRRWDQLATLQQNVQKKGALTDEVSAAIKARELAIGKIYVGEKARVDLKRLSPAEEQIVEACAEYAAMLHRQGKQPFRTMEQIRAHGLIGAAERSVSKGGHTQGYQTLIDEDRQEVSYEQIVVNHPGEFSPRAIWYARRTLGLRNDQNRPPADANTQTQQRCLALLDWYEQRAAECRGRLAGYTNATLAAVLGLKDLSIHGRVMGNVQSRIDFACYECRLPPLGLTADAPYAKAWSQDDRTWAFPIPEMQLAAQRRLWREADFDAIRERLDGLPGQAHISWRQALAANEEDLRTWAYSLNNAPSDDLQEGPGVPARGWSRDELILAIDFYFKHRQSIPGSASSELSDLAAVLGKLRTQIGLPHAVPTAQSVHMLVQSFGTFEKHQPTPDTNTLQSEAATVWKLFSNNLMHLSEVVAAIHVAINEADDPGGDDFDTFDTEDAEEGRLLTRFHRSRERNRQLVVIKKKRALKAHGFLYCEACGFKFSSKYGPQSATIIDCHHTKPVHTLQEGHRTHLDDLSLLCANCHRVIHASRPWLTIAELKVRLSENSQMPGLPP